MQKAVITVTEQTGKPTGTLALKNHGVIMNKAHDMVQDLIAIHNIPVSRIEDTIHAIAATAGIEVEGSISERGIGQIMLEGEVAATVQLVDEISKAKGLYQSGYCYDLPLVSLSRIYDNFSFHATSFLNSSLAFSS